MAGGKEAREESGLTAALLGVSLLGARRPWGGEGAEKGGRKGGGTKNSRSRMRRC